MRVSDEDSPEVGFPQGQRQEGVGSVSRSQAEVTVVTEAPFSFPSTRFPASFQSGNAVRPGPAARCFHEVLVVSLLPKGHTWCLGVRHDPAAGSGRNWIRPWRCGPTEKVRKGC